MQGPIIVAMCILDLFFIFYWSIVDLQCCVSFRCYYVSLPKENLPQEIQI